MLNQKLLNLSFSSVTIRGNLPKEKGNDNEKTWTIQNQLNSLTTIGTINVLGGLIEQYDKDKTVHYDVELIKPDNAPLNIQITKFINPENINFEEIRAKTSHEKQIAEVDPNMDIILKHYSQNKD
jgi:hypothetical protein